MTGDLLAGTTDPNPLLPGAPGRSLRGLYWDHRSSLVWAVGNDDKGARVWAVDDTRGTVEFESKVEGGVFLNDLVVSERAVWVTDSRLDRLTIIPLREDGTPTGAGPTFKALGGAWPAEPTGAVINANGIRLLPDGDLVLNNSRVGGLWQVDPASGVATEIPVRGGPGIVTGDGLETDGTILYNVRGSGQNEVSVLRLSPTATGWSAKWAGARTDETLDVPSTATLAGGWLWAVNARFGVASPESADYWISRLPAV